MKLETTNYLEVGSKLKALGCTHSEGIVLLPSNFESAESAGEFVHLSETSTVQTLLRNSGTPVSRVEDEEKGSSYISNHSFEWLGPIIFIPATFWLQQPNAIDVYVDVLTEYLLSYFKGMSGKKVVKIEVVVEKTKSKECKRVTYEGNVEGLKELTGIVKEVYDE